MAHHWHESVEIIRIISGRLNMKLNNRFFCAVYGLVVRFYGVHVYNGVTFKPFFKLTVYQIYRVMKLQHIAFCAYLGMK